MPTTDGEIDVMATILAEVRKAEAHRLISMCVHRVDDADNAKDKKLSQAFNDLLAEMKGNGVA